MKDRPKVVSKIFRESCDPGKDRNRNTEFNNLKKTNPSITHQEAFDQIESAEYCECGEKSLFVSLKLGYSKYCSLRCLHLDNEYKLDRILELGKQNKLSPYIFTKIKEYYGHSVQDIYEMIYGKGKCTHVDCEKIPNFSNFQVGFLDYCSVACSNHYKDFSRSESKNEEMQEKRRNTTLSRYGVEHNFQLLDNTGADNIFSSENNSKKSILAREKKRETMISKHNREFPGFSYDITNRDYLSEEYILENFVENDRFNIKEAMDFYNCSRTYFQKFNLPKKINYGEEWAHSLIQGIQNSRSVIPPLELDCVNLDKSVAVEFNGLAYHSSGYSKSTVFNKEDSPLYHLNKTELCEEKGIQLFHVFENEYLDDRTRKIWESMILAKTSPSLHRIFARETVVREVSNKEAREFLQNNHMQGNSNAKIKIGLYYKDSLKQIMTLSSPRFNHNYQYELIRMCSKLNTSIIGGASKLLKYFERNYNPESIISYANRRWSTGNVYEKLGFEFLYNTKPNYFYFKLNENVLYSRNKFQKHKLPGLLEEFDTELTETENMFNNQYRKIYDSGNKVYIKKY